MTGDTTETATAAVTWTEVDGVAVVHGHEPGPLAGSLMFRVGKTDEYLYANGITHLAEHLALFALGQPPHYQNGSVRTCVTTFDSVGDDDQVVSFFAGACEALSRLDGDRLEAERRVLEVEAQQRGIGLSSQLFTWRYGATGPGLWGFEEYAVRGIGIEAVQAWADHVFRAENAVLVLSAPPPAGLHLPLPRGARLPVPALEPMLPQTPAQFATARNAVGALAAVPRSVAASTYSELLRRRLVERLRRDLAVSYAPSVDYDRYDGTTAHLLVVADVHPDHLAAATTALVDVVDQMIDDPVSERELAEVKDERRKSMSRADSTGKSVVEGINWLLSGERTAWNHSDAEAEALTPDDLVAAARQARDGMLYAVPQGAGLDTQRVVDAPRSSLQPALGDGIPLVPSTAAPAGSALRSSHEGLERTWSDGTRATVRYGTARAMLAYPSGTRVLIGPDATAVTVEPAEWVGARELVPAIDAAASRVVVPMPEAPRNDPPRPPAAPVPSATSWISRLVLGIISFTGAIVMVLAGTDPSAGDVRATLFLLAVFFMLVGRWLISNAVRDRRRWRAARPPA